MRARLLKLRLLPAPLLLAGVAAVLLAVRAGASGTELLQDGSFETWALSGPASWGVAGPVALAQVSAPSVSGMAVQATVNGASKLSQTVAASPGATYDATVSAASLAGSGTVTLRLTFFDAGLTVVGFPVEDSASPGASFALLTVHTVAPPGTVYVRLEIAFDALGTPPYVAVVDEASLLETAGPPGSPSPSPGASATVAPTTPSGEPPTATPTRTATPTKTPTPLPGQGDPGRARAPRTSRISAPHPARIPDDGSLLANGGFEMLDGDGPLFWSKFGGMVFLDENPRAGDYAAGIISLTSSTKWVYQVAMVEPGGWYEGEAEARLTSGDALLFLRLTWYRTSDGSGRAISSVDSHTLAETSWAKLTTGPVQVPPEAHSVRFRLMLQPEGPASAAFDNARLAAAEQPVATSTPTTGDPAASATPPPSQQATATQSASPGTSATATGPGGRPSVTPRPPNTGSGLRQAAAGPLRLSEVYSDPAENGRDASYEWVELVNVSTQAVDLDGWKLGDAKQASVLPELALPPGGYAVVAGRAAHLDDGVPVARLADTDIGGGLNNSGDALHLVDPGGLEVDAISYGEDTSVFTGGPPAPGAGRSIGLRDPAGAASPANWALTSEVSPGRANSFFAAPGDATPGEAAASTLSADRSTGAPVRFSSGGDSPLPWLLTGMAGAAGGAALALGARPAVARVRRRTHGR